MLWDTQHHDMEFKQRANSATHQQRCCIKRQEFWVSVIADFKDDERQEKSDKVKTPKRCKIESKKNKTTTLTIYTQHQLSMENNENRWNNMSAAIKINLCSFSDNAVDDPLISLPNCTATQWYGCILVSVTKCYKSISARIS